MSSITSEISQEMFFKAAKEGDLAALSAAIELGADVNAKKDKGKTALMFAIENGHVDVAKALINSGANVNAANLFGETALMSASAFRHLEIVRALLLAGADVKAKNQCGETALMRAKQFYGESVADLLKTTEIEQADARYENKKGWLMACVMASREDSFASEIVSDAGFRV